MRAAAEPARLPSRRSLTDSTGASDGLREDDLAAAGLFVELADADDLLDLGDEVLDREAEHVDACLAGVEADTRVAVELDEFRDGRDVDLLHLPRHHSGGECGEAGDRADPGRQVHAG